MKSGLAHLAVRPGRGGVEQPGDTQTWILGNEFSSQSTPVRAQPPPFPALPPPCGIFPSSLTTPLHRATTSSPGLHPCRFHRQRMNPEPGTERPRPVVGQQTGAGGGQTAGGDGRAGRQRRCRAAGGTAPAAARRPPSGWELAVGKADPVPRGRSPSSVGMRLHELPGWRGGGRAQLGAVSPFGTGSPRAEPLPLRRGKGCSRDPGRLGAEGLEASSRQGW